MALNSLYCADVPLSYKIVTGHVAINPDQIGLVAADNRTRANHRYKFMAIGASSTGLCSLLLSEQSVIGTSFLLPSFLLVEQENPAAFKAQLARCAPVRMPWPTTTISVILHEEVYWLLRKTRRQDKQLLTHSLTHSPLREKPLSITGAALSYRPHPSCQQRQSSEETRIHARRPTVSPGFSRTVL